MSRATFATKLLLTTAVTALFATLAACSSEEPSTAGEEAEVVGDGFDCNLSSVLCRITPPQCPNGKTPTARNGCYGPCVDVALCKTGSYDCDQGGPALCRIVPPQCAEGETLTTRNGCFGPCVPSRVCQGGGGNAPAPSGGGTADCDISRVMCRITTPQCPEGKTPTVDADGFCYGECVDIGQCKPHSYDCAQGGPALCRMVPPECAEGETLTTRDSCFGPCVPSAVCK